MRTWITALIVFAASCTGGKKIADSEIETIKFGNGGGFTGASNTYLLKQDGTLGKEGSKGFEAIRTIEKEQVSHLFQKAVTLKDYKYYKPGNIYNFIEIVKPSGNNNITWGMKAGEVDTSVISLYKELSLLVNKLY